MSGVTRDGRADRPLFGNTLPTAALLAILTALSELVFFLRGRLPFTSDQSIISLMALDVLTKGRHPVFCYGAAYGGTLEVHYLAGAFGVLGANPRAFHLATAVLLILIVLLTWTCTSRAFGRRAGILAGLYLAIGPAYFLFKGLTSDGAYDTLSLCFALVLMAFIELLRDPPIEGRRALAWVAVAGGALGVAFWTLPLAVTIAPAVVAGALLGRKREWFRPRSLALAALFFFLGSFPWWIWNLRHAWASVRAPELAPAAAGQMWESLASLLGEGLPTIFGGRSVWTVDWAFSASHALALGLAALLFLGAVFLLLGARNPPRRNALILFLAFGTSLVVLALATRRTDFREPRYLFPLYLVIAPVVGLLLDALASISRVPFIASLVFVLGFNVSSQVSARRLKDCEAHTCYDPYQQIDWLVARGVRSLYTPYWSAYRITFLSNGRVPATPFGTGALGFTRHAELRQQVDASATPSFLLDQDDRSRFQRFLSRGGYSFHAEKRGTFTLFTEVAPQAIQKIRACENCIPLFPKPGEIIWEGVAGPSAIAAGTIATYHVSFQNRTGLEFQENVHLGYRWRYPDGGDSVYEGRGIFANVPRMGARVSEPTSVRAPSRAGEYDLVFDLVDENVDWFETYGIPPLVRRVTVRLSAMP